MDIHICTECNREFKTLSGLISHRKSHIDEKDFVAPEYDPGPRFDTVPEEEVLNPDPNFSVLRIRKLPNYGNLPDIAKQTPGSAGYDLYAAIAVPVCIGAAERQQIPTGIAIELPTATVGLVCPRSGLAWKNGISLVNTPGVIDSDYRGEIICIMINHSNTKFWVQPGMRIAQLLISPVMTPTVEYVDELSDTSRGEGRFGSTGSK